MSLEHKIVRLANAPTSPPDETETAVAQALLDLENSVPDLKMELRPLQISAAREVDVRGGKKAIVVFVPVPQLKAFHKVQARYVLSCPAILHGLGPHSRVPVQAAYSRRMDVFTNQSFLGLLVSWRRNSPTDMLFSWRNAGSFASRRARPASSKSGRVAGL
jgi:hypothetical protein